jgi:hypothetical protein
LLLFKKRGGALAIPTWFVHLLVALHHRVVHPGVISIVR